MTRRELYLEGKKRLEKAGADAPAFDALCLWQEVYGGGREQLALCGSQRCQEKERQAFEQLLRRREAGEPLQYILGEWDFLGLTLYVEPGVLIPRPETELLCETAAEQLLKTGGHSVLDLCAGTGAAGLGVCSLLPAAEAACVELYDRPYSCLCRNIGRYPQYAAEAVRGDVLVGIAHFDRVFDGLISNPPYISSAQLPLLQREVRQEPQEALDGGVDGLMFYRAILKRWLKNIRSGGFLAVEIGEDQGEAVGEMMKKAGLQEVHVLKDFSGLDRVVCGTVK